MCGKLNDSESLLPVRFDLWNSDVLSGKKPRKEGRKPARCDEFAGLGIQDFNERIEGRAIAIHWRVHVPGRP